jgi:hypothetical protein
MGCGESCANEKTINFRITAISALWQMFAPAGMVQSGHIVIPLTRDFPIVHHPTHGPSPGALWRSACVHEKGTILQLTGKIISIAALIRSGTGIPKLFKESRWSNGLNGPHKSYHK